MKNDNSIGSIDKKEADKKLNSTVITGVLNAAASLLPVVGELVSSTIPDIYKSFKSKAFNEYLYGINKSLQSGEFGEEQVKDLAEKLENADNYVHLSSIIDSVFFSKSKRARIILGLITARYFKDSSIPYEDLIIITALKELLDEDIDSFLTIYEVAKNGGREDSNGVGAFYFAYYPNQIQINTAFSKLQQLNVIGSKADWLTSKSPASWHGNVTSITEKLKYYIDLSASKEESADS